MRAETSADTIERDEGPTRELVSRVASALDAGDISAVKADVLDLRPPDLADLVELLDPDDRVRLIEALGSDIDFAFFSELDPAVRDQLGEALPNETIARAVGDLDTDDAAYVIESLEPDDRQEVLDQLPSGDRAALERNLEYPEETAGRLMQAEFVAVAPFWNVGRVIDHMREAEDLPDSFQEIYVVDPGFKVLGSVDLSRLLRSKRQVLISDIMETDREVVLATDDQEEVARQFERYGLMSAPVVDENNRLVGMLTVDDVVEVLEQEADEDIKALAGVGDERLTDSIRTIVPNRFWWLLINLGTAILASSVIGLFDGSLEKMVALAVLMPIVASMGGNAGTQTMTVAVRALATRELTPANAVRIVIRETTIGLINGLVFALLIGIIAYAWFGGVALGVVIAAAMVINLLAAALAGIFVPIWLDRLGHDPAVSSTVFVTTVTDVVGFLSFLGLATAFLL